MNEFLRQLLFLPPQSSTVAKEIDYLHYSVISVTMLGAFAVALAAGYFILRYRQSTRRGSLGLDQDSRHLAGGIPRWVEFAAIAFLLVLFVGWWVVGFRQFIKLDTPPKNALEIYVTAKQWMWSFAYPNGTGSNGVIYVPANRPVKLLLSSRDVIHSFYVPSFRIKKDAVPGYMTTVWFEVKEPGTYPVYCTEYCGDGHSTMRAKVVALDEQAFVERIERLPPLDIVGPEYQEPAVVGRLPAVALSLAEMGERLAARHGCLRCHTVDGTPHIGPTWAGAYGSEIALRSGERMLADEAYLTESMMDPNVHVRAGFQPIMPSYQGLLTAGETGALLEYIRSLADPEVDGKLSPLPPEGASPVDLPTEIPGPMGLERRTVPRAPVSGIDLREDGGADESVGRDRGETSKEAE